MMWNSGITQAMTDPSCCDELNLAQHRVQRMGTVLVKHPKFFKRMFP